MPSQTRAAWLLASPSGVNDIISRFQSIPFQSDFSLHRLILVQLYCTTLRFAIPNRSQLYLVPIRVRYRGTCIRFFTDFSSTDTGSERTIPAANYMYTIYRQTVRPPLPGSPDHRRAPRYSLSLTDGTTSGAPLRHRTPVCATTIARGSGRAAVLTLRDVAHHIFIIRTTVYLYNFKYSVPTGTSTMTSTF